MPGLTLKNSVSAIAVLSLVSAIYFLTPVGVFAGKPAGYQADIAHSIYAPDLADVSVLHREQFAHIELTDQDGQNFRFDQGIGNVTILNYMFSGCPVECPRQTAQLRDILRAVNGTLEDKTVNILSVTITPETDGVGTLKSFASRFDIDTPDWRFARASRKDTNELLSRFAVISNLDNSNPLNHRNVIYLFNADGVMVKQYAADPINTDRVTNEVLQLVRFTN